MQFLFESNYQSFHEHPNQYFSFFGVISFYHHDTRDITDLFLLRATVRENFTRDRPPDKSAAIKVQPEGRSASIFPRRTNVHLPLRHSDNQGIVACLATAKSPRTRRREGWKGGREGNNLEIVPRRRAASPSISIFPATLPAGGSSSPCTPDRFPLPVISFAMFLREDVN